MRRARGTAPAGVPAANRNAAPAADETDRLIRLTESMKEEDT